MQKRDAPSKKFQFVALVVIVAATTTIFGCRGEKPATPAVPTPSKAARSAKSERTSPVTFYRQVVAELRKVVWPTQQQLITYFFVVLVFVLAVMLLVSVLDLAFGKLVFELFAGNSAQ